MSSELLVLFTMDVEPAAPAAGISGPASDEAGLRAVRDYQDALGARGWRATYFVHPEVAAANPGFFKQLSGQGCALGLHLHTTKFNSIRHDVELGGLSAGEQGLVIDKAAELFEAGMGFRPKLFRPGCFSASDATYGVLARLGFEGGGVSIPGRIWPERFCVWAGAYPYAHFANESFRQARGRRGFVDIPLSVDMTGQLAWHPVGFYHYPDLRPGGVYSEEEESAVDRRALLRNILRRMAHDDPPVKTLVIDVHNDRDFLNPEAQAARHLKAVLDGIEPECRELGWTPVSSTYTEAVALFPGRASGAM